MANPAFATRYRLPDGRIAVDVTENKTLAAKDSGIVQNVIANSIIVTLPATAVVGSYVVRDGGVPTTGGPVGAVVKPAIVTVDPDAADTIAGLNVEGAAADGKYVRNTAGRIGDEITITNGPTNGGYIDGAVIGDWLREA